MLELTTNDSGLSIPDPVAGRIVLLVPAAETVVLNPDNMKKTKLAYSLELYRPGGTDLEYVIPLVEGSITVRGEVTR
ncbi:hypothetical protein D3C81_1679180 [compost metagenome]